MRVRGWMTLAVGALLAVSAGSVQAQEASARRAWLGFVWTASEDDGVQSVEIENVYPGSPAARAGLRSGEVIVRWNGSGDVERRMEELRLSAGDSIRLRVRGTNGRERDLLVVAENRPAGVMALRADSANYLFGVSPEEWREVQRQLQESQEQIARIFRENFDAEEMRRSFRMDTLAFRMDTLAFRMDSVGRGFRVFFRDEMEPRIAGMLREMRVEGPGENPVAMFSLGARSVAGAEFERMTDGLASYFGTDRGLLVLRVSSGTPAARSGLQPGDVVLEAAGKRVDSVDALREEIARAGGPRPRTIELEVLRRGQREEVDLRWE